MNKHHFCINTGTLAGFISVIVGMVWWYPTTIGGSSQLGHAAHPRLLPAICVVIAACLLWADRVTLRIRTAEAVTQPAPKTVLIWNLAMVGMAGVFWWIASPLQFGGGFYLCTFCFGSIGFAALFVYIATMNTIITWHVLLNVQHKFKRDHARTRLTPLLAVFSFLLVFWFGVYDSWEGWHLRLYWDDYQDVIQMDPDQLIEMSPGWLWEPIPGEISSPRILPQDYQYLAKDGFRLDDGNEVFFFAWYGGPTASRGLMYSTDPGYCFIPSMYMTADSTCIEIRRNWYRFAVW